MKKSTLEELQQNIKTYRNDWRSKKLTTAQRSKLEEDIEAAEMAWNDITVTNGDRPLVSVVMSVYNTEKYVAAALRSILEQTFTDFEVILIDDGCSDDSISIAESFNDDRVRVIHQNNHGLVYSFNKGIRLSRGVYIARMDADDISLPSRFEKELNWLLAKPDRGLVGTFFRYIDQETAAPLNVIQYSPTKHIDIVRMMYMVNPFGHGSVMMRKDAVIQAGGYHPEYEPSEDYDLWRRIAKEWEVGQIPEVMYFWRFQTSGLGNISQRKREQSNASASKTVSNLWSGPLYLKTVRQIVKDGRELRLGYGSLGETLYQQYISQQYFLTREFARRKYVRSAFKNLLAVFWLERSRTIRHYFKPRTIIKKLFKRSYK